MISAVTSAYNMVSKHGFADIMQNGISGERSLHAAAFFDAGDLVTAFTADKILDAPTRLTIQTGPAKHITLLPDFLQYVNHSCRPNVFFDTTLMELIAIKEIQPGDEFLFFYPSTEWEMSEPFDCSCGTPACLKNIQGAAYLPDEEAMRYRLTDFICEQLLNRKNK